MFVVSFPVFGLSFLAFGFAFFLGGSLTSLALGSAENFGGVALKNMRGFRENMGKKVFVEGKVEFGSLGTSLAVRITRSGLSSSVSLGSLPLGLFRGSIKRVVTKLPSVLFV